MASLRRYPTSKFWYACFTMPDSRRVQRSTRELDRKKAQKLADTFEEATRAKQTARTAQRVISEIYQNATGDKLPSATVRGYFDSWLARKKPETAASTFAFYQGKAQSFLAFLGQRAGGKLARLDTSDVLAFRKAEAERVAAYIAMRQAEAQAAAVLAEAIARARELLTASGVDDPEEILGAISMPRRRGRQGGKAAPAAGSAGAGQGREVCQGISGARARATPFRLGPERQAVGRKVNPLEFDLTQTCRWSDPGGGVFHADGCRECQHRCRCSAQTIMRAALLLCCLVLLTACVTDDSASHRRYGEVRNSKHRRPHKLSAFGPPRSTATTSAGIGVPVPAGPATNDSASQQSAFDPMAAKPPAGSQ